ncbi:MAG TPA: phosphoribosylaminoimidazolesuccinocarboxamide synthase [Blastocatellia bacterium]|nr:phosphoribosylaminoimidazolesuccinocarboxamide synthase [Blastocatellia bacterium]HMV87833.1 phosphoribosylaminoimidazolesuccinocarboxamide synthase [Blastocatellia bacterium]HMX26613.1 phosphoribosylaminoimidazolesuccinocarboxamide synthase [Blastocatellia bacterium]HMY72703.1 phosphoribosylaminoimidazolesuccinocarboxamide synthase [Blastocatellia bacterium]HNG32605.1 phosphoribosylaminoimidazolesuccinocarboxamide synthase [Blastocatellia bacterium]
MNGVSTNRAENERIAELTFLRSGKVRDIYEVDENHLLIVATDRISAFDCVLPNAIPYKGQVLTGLSRFWFAKFADLTPNHLLAAEVNEFPEALRDRLSVESKAWLAGRTMFVRRAEVIPFECVVRGYLAGSGWKEYQATGAICGHLLPEGLTESAKLPQPIFTPATKAETGHDINVSVAEMAAALGEELTRELEALSLELYSEAAAYAEPRGIIICDTKFEFGLRDRQVTLVDEVLTPDSSRFWPRDSYSPGRSQPSFDKQFVRDYLETLDWDKHPPAPTLPEQVVSGTSARYLEAFRLITGHDLPNQYPEA